MVGFLFRSGQEAQERVRTALKNAGIHLPPKKVMVNLSPGDIRKEGTAYDLAMQRQCSAVLGGVRGRA